LILIFSRETELSTSNVLLWLKSYKESYIRITEHTKIVIDKLYLANSGYDVNFKIDGQLLSLSNVKSFWIWHGNIYNTFVNKFKENNYPDGVLQAFKSDRKTLMEYVKYCIESKSGLGKFSKQNSNKLIYLSKAQEIGMNIPETFVINNKKDLTKLIEENGLLITKAIQDNPTVNLDNHWYLQYTEKISEKFAETMPESFFLSLFQKLVEKFVDVRVFYLDGECFGIAIFSQSGKSSSIDLRNRPEIPNRQVPIKLPAQLLEKIENFMNIMNHRIGSLDFVLTKDGKFIFLELNPVGQIGFVSFNSNTYLEKKIAQKLLN